MTDRIETLREEIASALTHGLGAAAALAGGAVLITLAALYGDGWQLSAAIVFGITLLLLYTASTLYHAIQHPTAKGRLQIFDHCAIYLLIAGTYTPMLLITLAGNATAQVMLWVIWGLALGGVLFKLWFIHRFKKLSLITYLLMGWLSMILIRDLWHTLARPGFWLLLGGGLCFTIGAGFYAAKQVRYTHAVWHVFVAAGAACHALLIGLYVIPAGSCW